MEEEEGKGEGIREEDRRNKKGGRGRKTERNRRKRNDKLIMIGLA